jgi:hypothetical protein
MVGCHAARIPVHKISRLLVFYLHGTFRSFRGSNRGFPVLSIAVLVLVLETPESIQSDQPFEVKRNPNIWPV